MASLAKRKKRQVLGVYEGTRVARLFTSRRIALKPRTSPAWAFLRNAGIAARSLAHSLALG